MGKVEAYRVPLGVLAGFICIAGGVANFTRWYYGVAIVVLWYVPFPNPIKRYSAMFMLAAMGFRYQDRAKHGLALPRDAAKMPKKFVVIGEPHTHLWDFMAMQVFFAYYNLPLVYVLVGKKYTQVPVLGTVLKIMGALEVDTESGKKEGKVQQAVGALDRAHNMILHIPPSGKRGKGDSWRSGFYYVAKLAKVPIVCAWLDASTGTFGFEAPILPTDDVTVDMDKIRAVYADKRGFVPANESVVRLTAEGGAAK